MIRGIARSWLQPRSHTDIPDNANYGTPSTSVTVGAVSAWSDLHRTNMPRAKHGAVCVKTLEQIRELRLEVSRLRLEVQRNLAVPVFLLAVDTVGEHGGQKTRQPGGENLLLDHPAGQPLF